MKTARFRFYAELNDHLPRSRRGREFEHPFSGEPAVKGVVEAIGVPHTEVDLILVDGASKDFGHPLRGGERVSVYPVFESIDITPVLRLRPRPLRVPRFVLDGHLGKLARILRLLGLDAVWWRDPDDAELARVSAAAGRILLTRDRGVLKRSLVSRGYWVREERPRRQAAEVLRRFDLASSLEPFSRCLCCNARLKPAREPELGERLPPGVRALHDTFLVCPACGRAYWPGSHHEAMKRLVAELRAALVAP